MKIWTNIVATANNNRELGNSQVTVHGQLVQRSWVKDKGKIEDKSRSLVKIAREKQHNRPQCAVQIRNGS